MDASAVFVLLVLPAAIAGPVLMSSGNPEACATRCPDASNFAYKQDTTYEYRYEVETRTTMTGAAEDTATIKISATALVEVLGSCEMALRLTDVAIKRSHEANPQRMVGADDMSTARRALEEQPLRFAFYDGAVGEVCPGEGEGLWALNIKRGVLTSFQNSMRQRERDELVQEVDVIGQCPTQYKVTQKGWKTLTINKVKDILSCTNRHGYRTSLLSTPYRSPNSMQSLPLLKSSHECHHDIGLDGVLQASTCSEVHIFRPFSKSSSGASTETSQKLTYLRDSRGVTTRSGPVVRRTSLLFEHQPGQAQEDSTVQIVADKLEEMCTVSKVDIRPQVPHMFGELVYLMRNLDLSDLRDVNKRLQQNSICTGNTEKARKFFRDALPVTATGASLMMMSDLLGSEKIADAQVTFWLTSLAFVPNPTKDLVSGLQSLLAIDKIRMDALLPASALVNNYCENNPDCGQTTEVTQVLNKLTGTLGYNCNVNSNIFKEVLLTLRAIGNIGRSSAVTLNLEPCLTKSEVPMDVRVAAIDAYRRVPCSADRNNIMQLFLRHTEDSELRIAAYLAVMKCPSDSVLRQVRQALLKEEVNQVGSFVWTHLTNLLETDSPHKQAIRDVLENELLQVEFNKDRRKYSRNYELSFFSDKFNLGGVYENNLIWSAKSFLPRSAMFNLTVDMFGKSVNLLEVGGRVQGLEYLLEAYFGPSSRETGNAAGYGTTDVVKDEKLARTKSRFGDIKDDLRAQVYLRVFGNELAFKGLDGDDVAKWRNRGDKKKSLMDEVLEKLAKNEELSFTQSAIFLDSSIIIPTAAGLPLNLTVNGSASVELKASGKMDFTKLSGKSQSLEIAADIQPSGAVELSSMMSVDAFVTKVGLKMTSRLHTSTAFKGRIELARGQTFSVEIDTPRETQEIMDFQSKFFILHDDYVKEQQMITSNRKEKTACTGEPLAKVVGLKLCASLSFPNATLALDAPYFPFTGPTSVAVTLRKSDTHTGYRLLTKQITSDTAIFQIAMDTPGSKIDRAVSFSYVANPKDYTLEAELLSPWKKATLKLAAENGKKSTKGSGTLTLDTVNEYAVNFDLDKDIRDSKKGYSAKLKPSLTVTSPQGKLLSLGTEVEYREDKLLSISKFELEIKDVLEKPISMDFELNIRDRKDKMNYKNNLKFASQWANIKSSSNVVVGSFNGNKRTALLLVRSRIDYTFPTISAIKKNQLNIGFKLNDKSTSSLNKYGFNLNLEAKYTPDWNVLLNGEVIHKKSVTEMDVKIRHGKNVKVKSDNSKEIQIAGFVNHVVKGDSAAVKFDVKAIYPDKDIEYQVTGKHDHDKRGVEQYLTVRYAKGKSLDAHLRLDEQKKQRTATFDLAYPGREVKVNVDLTEKSKTQYLMSAMAQLQKGEKNFLVISYERPSQDSVIINSEVGIYNRPPSRLEMTANYRERGMRGFGQLQWENKNYSMELTSDIQREKYVKWTMDIVHPNRTITVLIEGGKEEAEMVKRALFDVQWDVQRDPIKRVGLTIEMADKQKPEDINLGGMVQVFTPVQDYNQLKVELKQQITSRRFQTIAETILGDKSKEYSFRVQLNQPISAENLDGVAWLKTPHYPVRHVEVSGQHSFSSSGQLSSGVKGIFNQHSLEAKLSGSKTGTIVSRILEGTATFTSTITGARDLRLTFNHNDDGRTYFTQTVLNHDGNQYSVSMDINFVKVHWQITTNGKMEVRVPQWQHPLQLSWNHMNNLHEMTSTATFTWDFGKRAKLDMGITTNVVAHIYGLDVTFVGPWKEGGEDYQSSLKVNYHYKGQVSRDMDATLVLDIDTYRYEDTVRMTDSSYTSSFVFTMTNPPFRTDAAYNVQYKDFPMVASVDIKLDNKPMINFNVMVENPKEDSYASNLRFALEFENISETVVANARHDKKRGKWITKGAVSYQVGKTIKYETVVDVDKYNEKMVKISLDTPYEEVSSIALEYSHSGNVEGNFSARATLSVDPIFDTVSTEISWNNRQKFTSKFRVDTPFEELRYLEVTSNSQMEGSKHRAYLKLDYHPRQVYELDTLYIFKYPEEADIVFNLTTPRKELPSLSTELGYQYTDDEVTGKIKFNGPSFNFDGFSTNFGHKRGKSSISSRIDAFIPPQKKWSGTADLSWANEIQGTINMESNVEGVHPTQLILSHRGHTWEDFHTKAGFRRNGDRLESEVAYSNKDGKSGLFMLATPDPDLDYFKTTFFQRLTNDSFEGRWTAQYGETSQPYEYGVKTTYSEKEIAFDTDLKTPYSEDLAVNLGFETRTQVLAKLHAMYGDDNSIDTLVKYKLLESLWDVGAEFGYRIQGSGRNIGLTFRKEGTLDDLTSHSTMKYMGKEVNVDVVYRDTGKKSGKVNVRTNFEGYTDLATSFEYNGDMDKFDTKVYLKYRDNKEAECKVDFERIKSRRAIMTATLKLPFPEYAENKLTYKHNYRKDKLSADVVLNLGQARPIKGEVEFNDDSTLTVTVTGPHKDFDTFRATGTYNQASMSLDGDATLTLVSQRKPITATYMVKAETWPIMVNVKADTPYTDWESTELTVTHDGLWDAFSTSATLQARAVGKVTTEATWTYKEPAVFEGMWIFSSAIDGAKDLKLLVKNTKGDRSEYSSHVEIGWELLKQIVLDGTLRMTPDEVSSQYGGSLSMSTPFPQVSNLGFTFGHTHSDLKIKDTAVVTYNQKIYLDTDFEYYVENGRKRVGSVDFREPRPMAFLVGGYYGDEQMEGELKLNWDKTSPMMNVHLTGEYSDRTDSLGTDRALKMWAMHPARTMGLEHTLRKSNTEFRSDAMLTWDKAQGSTVLYDVSWNDRSSRYSKSYDAMVKVGCPLNTMKLEGMYSDTGRTKGAKGSVMWDVDRNEDLKVGINAELDTRGQTNRLQLDLDLPFIDKKYGYVMEGAVMSGNTIIQQRTEFSYSPDPRKLLVISSSIQDISYGSDASNYTVTVGVTHPITDVSFKVTSHFGLSEVLGTMATEVMYMTAARENKNLELRGQIDKLRKTMLAQLKSPIKNVALEGTLTGDASYNMKLTSNEDGQRSQVTDIFVDPKTRTFELKYYYDKNDQSKTVNVFGHMLDDKLLQTEVYTVHKGQRVSETLVTLRLNSSHVLHTRLNWRPSMLTDLQQYLSTQLTIFSYASSEIFSGAAQAVGQEVEAKYNTIMREIKEETGPLFQQLQLEMTAMQGRLDGIHRDLRRLYGRNALHVQDMGELVNVAFNSMINGSRALSEQFRGFYAEAQTKLAQSVHALGRYPMAQKYAQLVHDFASGLKNTRTVLEQALDQLSLQVADLSDKSYRRYLIISRQIERKLQGYTAALQQTSFGQMYGGLSQVSTAHIQQLREVTNQKMLLALEKLGLKETYLNLVTKANQMVTDQFSDVMQRPEFQQIYVISNEIYQQGIWAYQYWHVEQNLQAAAAQLLALAKDVTLLEITRIKNAVVDLDKSRVIVYDPVNGEMQFEIYLPVPLKSLAEPPDVRLTKYANRVKSWMATYVPSPRHSLWTTINNHMPNMDSTTWLPPYRAYAYVMGDQHVVTFDRSHYNFAGRCSYILARDMADDRFTVVLNYNNRPRQPQVESVVVMLRGVAIEIDTSNKIKVNNKVTELPFFSGPISAVRQQSIIRVRDGDDLTMEMDSSRGIYSVGISGWYHGRTAGLLGTYDNEPFNDLTDSERALARDVEDFANSWEVSARLCRSRNLAEISRLDGTEPEVEACSKHLNDSSSYYAPCFGQVDASELVRVCVEYVKAGLSQQEAQCKAGQQYRYMCQRRGVALGSPAECVTCDVPDDMAVTAGSVFERNTVNETQPSSADVLFVIEDGTCNNWARRTLSRTATELGQAMEKQGLTANRFGLLSFHEEDQFVHTIEGQVFGPPSSFLKATENLRLTESGKEANVLTALQEAMKYPYRVGVAKVLVLIPCSTCSRVDLHELGQVLLSNGFLLHVLNQQEFQAPGSGNRSPVPVFGVDRSGVHTRKSALRNSDALFQQITQPSDACAKLALHTNGSVFDVTHMKERDRVQNEFLEAFAARGAQNAALPRCQICSCHDDGTGRGHTVCQMCDEHSWIWNQIPTWLQASSTSVMGVFNDLHHRIITSLSLPPPDVSLAA